MSEQIIKKLMAHLPDNGQHAEDESWRWCWEELSSEAQDAVKTVRAEATQYLLDQILKEANS